MTSVCVAGPENLAYGKKMEAEIECPTCAPGQRALNPPVLYRSLDLRVTTLTIWGDDPSLMISLDGDDAEVFLGLLASTEFRWNVFGTDNFELIYVGDGSRASFLQMAADVEQYRASLAVVSVDVMDGRIPPEMFNRLEIRPFFLGADVLNVLVLLRTMFTPTLEEGSATDVVNTLVTLGDQTERFLVNGESGDLCGLLACIPAVVPPKMTCLWHVDDELDC